LESEAAIMNRAATLDAALVFFDLFKKSPCGPLGGETDEPYEQMLRRECEKAKEALDVWLKAKAARLALDSVLPGWYYIDASDHLPKEKWRSFVSNSKEEWSRWLFANGVSETAIQNLLEDHFK
jgi:hypothetical protein